MNLGGVGFYAHNPHIPDTLHSAQGDIIGTFGAKLREGVRGWAFFNNACFDVSVSSIIE
jgi:hypothetical protein